MIGSTCVNFLGPEISNKPYIPFFMQSRTSDRRELALGHFEFYNKLKEHPVHGVSEINFVADNVCPFHSILCFHLCPRLTVTFHDIIIILVRVMSQESINYILGSVFSV